MVRRFLIIVSLIASAASVVATARQLTLIERARAGNGHGENMLFMEFDDADVPQLTERADVIVHGTVVRMYTSMTPDERAIVTNYVVAPIRVLKERVPVVSAIRPQQTRELVISHPGGTLVDQRGSFSTIVDAYPLDERFAEGEQVVFFLRAKPDGTFTFAYGPSGAFRVANGVVRSMTKEIAERGGKGPQTPHTLPDLVRSVEFSLRRH